MIKPLRLMVTLTLSAAFLLAAGATGATAADRPPRVYVTGDSTAATYATSDAPRAGWGQALELFLAKDVEVVNEAWSGASSKSFVEAGKLDAILRDIRPGDYLLVSFGHNDQKTDERGTDPWSTYQDYLSLYVEGAREAGAIPVLVTSVERRRFDQSGEPQQSLGDYPEAMRELGARTDTPVVDLHAMSLDHWGTLGVEGTKAEFLWLAPGEHANYPAGVQDNTHFQERGAIELARLAVGAAKGQRVVSSDLTRRLGDEFPEGSLTWPATRPAED